MHSAQSLFPLPCEHRFLPMINVESPRRASRPSAPLVLKSHDFCISGDLISFQSSFPFPRKAPLTRHTPPRFRAPRARDVRTSLQRFPPPLTTSADGVRRLVLSRHPRIVGVLVRPRWQCNAEQCRACVLPERACSRAHALTPSPRELAGSRDYPLLARFGALRDF